jgi:hypothetical protein
MDVSGKRIVIWEEDVVIFLKVLLSRWFGEAEEGHEKPSVWIGDNLNEIRTKYLPNSCTENNYYFSQVSRIQKG